MAKELPYFRFTVAEWQNGDITLEDFETQGVFINICCYYWISDCRLPLEKLKQRLSNAIATIDILLKQNIIKEVDGFIVINFLDEQLENLQAERLKKQIAGKKGGLARASRAKAVLKHRSSYKDKDNDKEKDNPASLFTPEQEEKINDRVEKAKNGIFN